MFTAFRITQLVICTITIAIAGCGSSNSDSGTAAAPVGQSSTSASGGTPSSGAASSGTTASTSSSGTSNTSGSRGISGSTGTSSTSGTGTSSTASSGSSSGTPSGTLSADILVDQFGYRPTDSKVAVIRSPQVGYDSGSPYTPGTTFQVRRTSDNTVILSGSPSAWNSGAVQSSSGDKGWWFDFSSLTAADNYYLYDVTNKTRSATFNVGQRVYANALKAAMRMYFYQRSGSSSGGGAKHTPYADACWQDDPAYVGVGQDTQAHDATDQLNAAKVHDVSGGWFDAGDTNKYVTFATPAVHQLLTAYQNTPAVFTDDFNIPESGNGIPDVIDEVKYETDWLKKMQFNSDGSVALKVGALINTLSSPPSSDKTPRFYVPGCTSSTIAAAGMFAHAAYVYATIPALQTEAATLQADAIAAWNNYQASPTKQTGCDTGLVKAGNADWTAAEQQQEAVVAAVYLFAITGNSKYNTYVQANYKLTRPYNDIGWTRYNPEQGEALLFYTQLPNATSSLKSAILADKLSDVNAGNQIYGLTATDDLYRNFLHDPQYQWGSNQVRGNYGNSNADVQTYSIGVASPASYQTRALETLHYFHGVNPFAKVYLSNMYGYGATNSVNELYHTWFWPGTEWSDAKTSTCGPAPGYVPGGPVANAGSQGIPSSITPPVGQPEQKSYRDWNGIVSTTQNSYVINEAGIYYQSAYVELLSRFAQ